MNGHDLQDYRRRLEGLVAHLRAAKTRLETELRAWKAGPEPAPPAAPLGECMEELIRTEGEMLGEANEALSRIGAGTFGCCEECGQPISRARLGSMPFARYCAPCAHARTSGPRECVSTGA